jgi:hypothetical protein
MAGFTDASGIPAHGYVEGQPLEAVEPNRGVFGEDLATPPTHTSVAFGPKQQCLLSSRGHSHWRYGY